MATLLTMANSRSKRAAAKKRKKHAAQRSRRSAVGTATTRHVRSADKRLPAIFGVLDEIVGDAWTAASQAAAPTSREAQLQQFMFNRAINVMRGARMLLAQQHWELVAPMVRQLFEADLNLEWLQRQPDRADTVLRYVGFGVLQIGLARAAAVRYDLQSGRVCTDDPEEIERRLAQSFPRFLTPRSTAAHPRFASTWCGLSTRGLAEQSANPMRLQQYLTLFKGSWSEQAHAAPAVHVEQLFSDASDADWFARTLLDDDIELIQCAMLLVTFFLEHWHRMSSVRAVDPDRALGWTSRLREAGGGRLTPPVDGV